MVASKSGVELLASGSPGGVLPSLAPGPQPSPPLRYAGAPPWSLSWEMPVLRAPGVACTACQEAAGTSPHSLPATPSSAHPDHVVCPRAPGGLQLSWVLTPTSWWLPAEGAAEIHLGHQPLTCVPWLEVLVFGLGLSLSLCFDCDSQREMYTASPAPTHSHAHLLVNSAYLEFLGADMCRAVPRSLGSGVGLSAWVFWGLPSCGGPGLY